MYRIDDATAASSLPAPEAAGTEGYFTEGNPTAGTPATNVRGSWLNMIQEELCSLLVAAGITRSKTTYNQVNAALQKMYAPVIGTVRNLAMTVAAASATATVTADEIVVGGALGGQKYVLASFNKTVNLATTGAGGMDTGAAPASSFVGLYAIWNPTTSTAALLGVSANAVTLPTVYGGANMPAGFTASALISVWPTNASSQFFPGAQIDRLIGYGGALAVNSSAIATLTSVTTTAIPKNAKTFSGFLQVGSSALSAMSLAVFPMNINAAGQNNTCNVAAGSSQAVPFNRIPVVTPQTFFYTSTNSAGTPGFTVSINAYEI